MSLNRVRLQPYIYQVGVADLTPDDLRWLDKAIKGSYRGLLKRDEVLVQVAKGLVQLWRVGKWEGILITEILEHGLVHWHSAAGRGLITKLDVIIKFLCELCKVNNCTHWEVSTGRKGLQRIFEKRLRENTRTYFMEI